MKGTSSIRWRMRAGFYGGLAVLLAAGYVALRFASELDDSLTRVQRVHISAADALVRANTTLWKLRFASASFAALSPAEREPILREEPALRAAFIRAVDDFSALVAHPEATSEAIALKASFEHYVSARPKWFALIQNGQLVEAADWQARALAPYGRESTEQLERMTIKLQMVTRTTLISMRSDAKDTRHLLYALFVLSAIVAGMVWLRMRETMRSLYRARQIAEDAAIKLLGVPALVEGRNELDTLIATLRVTMDRFASHAEALAQTRDRLEAERAEKECEVQARTADLQRIVGQMAQRARSGQLHRELNERLHACQSIDEAAHIVAAMSAPLFDGHAGRISLINPSRNLADELAQWGSPAPSGSGVFAPDECWALRRGRVHVDQAAMPDVRCAHSAEMRQICVPLMSQEGAVGVLVLDAPDERSDEADLISRLGDIADIIAAAVAALRLRERLRQQSIRDVLTGLYNRRFLEEAMERELARAQRAGLPLSVLMLDVDHFKRFNDTYGHDVGDRVLQCVGRVLGQRVRVSDIACRYGGEEFTVLMPEAPPAAARERAEQLRQAIETESANFDPRIPGPITVSVGVATTPPYPAQPEALLGAADHALYEAKRAGRNRVEVATPGALP